MAFDGVEDVGGVTRRKYVSRQVKTEALRKRSDRVEDQE